MKVIALEEALSMEGLKIVSIHFGETPFFKIRQPLRPGLRLIRWSEHMKASKGDIGEKQ